MGLPKIIAKYLPQFHRVRENDIWWGPGFTEWTAVRKAGSLFQGHRQPRVPLHGNYYDLLQKDTMMWQADLAQKYGIDGMAFYHYWFKDGRKILEKPAELLLRWKDVPMNFCFCWANESWARTWSKLILKNDWMREADDGHPHDDDGILLKQAYGDEKDWREHIEYLLPFFQDDRYIKIDGRPVFLLYRPDDVHCLPDMIACWTEVLQAHGIRGIYLIGELIDGEIHGIHPDVNAWMIYEQLECEQTRTLEKDGVPCSEYEIQWRQLLRMARLTKADVPVYSCGRVDFDATPRRGKKGRVFLGATPEHFGKYFAQLLAIEAKKKSQFVFLNAWNEWGEGMYLEPDEERGYAMLEAVKRAKEACAYGEVLTNLPREGKMVSEESKELQMSEPELRAQVLRDRNNFARDIKVRQILVDWLRIALRGGHASDYLKHLGMTQIAVYGMGFLGQRFVEDLETAGLELVYVIDQRQDTAALRDVPVYHPDDALPDADAIVVTPYGLYDEIYASMKGHVPCRMISLEHMISELL